MTEEEMREAILADRRRDLRDQLAMATLKGLLSSQEYVNYPEGKLAYLAYAQADAMLEAREK